MRIGLFSRCAPPNGSGPSAGLRGWPDPADVAGTVAQLSVRGDLAGGLIAMALVRPGPLCWKGTAASPADRAAPAPGR
jgi:hypothetical protein